MSNKINLKKIISSFLLILQLFIFFIFPLYQVKAAEDLYFIHQDHLGSTTVITDESGKVVQQERNFPYGESRLSNTALESTQQSPITERGYTSQIKDVAVSLYYYNARYYDPALGTFVSADDSGDSVNRFAYVHGNPLRGIDPTGRSTDITNPGLGSSQMPGVSAGGVYVTTVQSTNLKNAHLPNSSGEPSDFYRTIAVAAGAAAGLPVGVVAGTSGPLLIPMAHAFIVGGQPVLTPSLAAALKITGGASFAYGMGSCAAGNQAACFSLMAAGEIQTMRKMAQVTGAAQVRARQERELAVIRTHVEQGLEMIKKGNYEQAMTHFGNQSMMKNAGLTNRAARTLFLSRDVGYDEVSTISDIIGGESMFYYPQGGYQPSLKVSSYLNMGNYNIPEELVHNVALIGAEEWTHALQYYGGSLAGFGDPELDVAAYFYNEGVPLTQDWLSRYGRIGIIP